MDRAIKGIQCLNEKIGQLMGWLVLVMVCLIGYDVVMRYLFQAGSVALQELEWHLFSLIFLLSAAYTFKHNAHVRVDVLYQSYFSDKTKLWVDLFGNTCLLLPFCLLLIWASGPFVYNSWQFNEASPDPGGLPYRFILKSMIPVGCFLLVMHGLADSFIKFKKLKGMSKQ